MAEKKKKKKKKMVERVDLEVWSLNEDTKSCVADKPLNNKGDMTPIPGSHVSWKSLKNWELF